MYIWKPVYLECAMFLPMSDLAGQLDSSPFLAGSSFPSIFEATCSNKKFYNYL